MYYCRNHPSYSYHCSQGGVDIGDVDAKALKLELPIETTPTDAQITNTLLGEVPQDRKRWDV